MVLKDRSSWVVLMFIGAVLVPTFFSPVSAFKVMDQAICKDIDFKTLTCQQRTSEFLATDEWAYFWFRMVLENSDVGAGPPEFRLYDPDGDLFLGGPFVAPYAISKAGEVVGYMGIGVAKANTKVGFVPGFTFSGVIGQQRPASEEPGEWRVEFALGGRVVVSERFSILGKAATSTAIPTTVRTPLETSTRVSTVPTVATTISARTETQPSALGSPSNLLLIAAVVVICSVAVGYMYTRRKRSASDSRGQMIGDQH